MDNNQNNAADTLVNTNSKQGTAWQLIGLSPALTDLTIDIENSLSVGRSDSNDLVLAASQISRQHAKITRMGEQLYVQDLGSSNGTFVNGERISIQAHALQATDELAFADLLFLVVNDNIDSLDTDALLSTLQEIENVTPSNVTDSQLEQAKQAEKIPLSVATPVIDIVTTQDFLPKNQSTATTEQPVRPNPIKEVAIDNSEANTANPTSNPTTATTTTMPTPNSVAQEDKLNTPQPTMAPVQQAQNSPMNTVAVEQKPAARKNASLAIIIIVIITLIIVATLFR